MKRLPAALLVLLSVVLLPLAASAATLTVPATAFRPYFNYDFSTVAYIKIPAAVGVLAAAEPSAAFGFWAPVVLPAGATITRVRYWYQDGVGYGTELSLMSFPWAAQGTNLATIKTTGVQANPVGTYTDDITEPVVKAGRKMMMLLLVSAEGFCYGVKIDYVP